MSLASLSLDLIETSTVGKNEVVRVKGKHTAQVKQIGVNVRMEGNGVFGNRRNPSPAEYVWGIEDLVSIHAYCEAPKGTTGLHDTDLKLGRY